MPRLVLGAAVRVGDWLFGRRRANLPDATVWVSSLGTTPLPPPSGRPCAEPFLTGWQEIGSTTRFEYDVADVDGEETTLFDPADMTRTVTMTQPLTPEQADLLAVWFESLHDCEPPIAVDNSFRMTAGSGDLRQTIRRGGTRTTWTCPGCRTDWLLTGTGQHWYRTDPLTFRKATV